VEEQPEGQDGGRVDKGEEEELGVAEETTYETEEEKT
jgi:hypothetical protein